MVRISFTSHLQRHIASPPTEVVAGTLADALNFVFRSNPVLKGYILDDQGAVRKHVAIFIDGQPILDRTQLSDSLREGASVYVMQALSGG